MSRFRIINARMKDGLFLKMKKQKEMLGLSNWESYLEFLYEINSGEKIDKIIKRYLTTERGLN